MSLFTSGLVFMAINSDAAVRDTIQAPIHCPHCERIEHRGWLLVSEAQPARRPAGTNRADERQGQRR
jgi:hypothetical protein